MLNFDCINLLGGVFGLGMRTSTLILTLTWEYCVCAVWFYVVVFTRNRRHPERVFLFYVASACACGFGCWVVNGDVIRCERYNSIRCLGGGQAICIRCRLDCGWPCGGDRTS